MTDAAELDRLIMLYAKAADGIGCERGSYLYDEIGRGLTAVLAAAKHDPHNGACPTCGFQIRPVQVRPSIQIEEQ